ncbi:aspartate/glutamate racemase family protein [Chloroflexota bacterium]
MRIWCQSSGALGKEEWNFYEQSLRRHIQKVVRPETVVDIYGTDFTIPGIGHYRASVHIAHPQAIRNAMRAEEQGYDAFVQLSTSDVGFQEVRELVNIPVIFSTETCLHLACLLADKFAFLTHNEIMLHRITELAERYGLAPRMVPGGHLQLFDYSDIMEIFRNPKRYIDSVISTAKEIGARGADLLFPSALSLNQWLVDNNLREVDGVVIMDVTGATLKMAELMLDLKDIGINRSPRYYSHPQPDVLEALKKVYGV